MTHKIVELNNPVPYHKLISMNGEPVYGYASHTDVMIQREYPFDLPTVMQVGRKVYGNEAQTRVILDAAVALNVSPLEILEVIDDESSGRLFEHDDIVIPIDLFRLIIDKGFVREYGHYLAVYGMLEKYRVHHNKVRVPKRLLYYQRNEFLIACDWLEDEGYPRVEQVRAAVEVARQTYLRIEASIVGGGM